MKERALALQALQEITEKNVHANASLNQLLKKEPERTQGFVRKIVYGVLDRLEELDSAINRANRSGRKRLDPAVRNILRLSLYQLRYMDKTAAHGVVNDAVRLAKKGAPRYAGFVNGMLRTLQREGPPQEVAQASMPAFLHEQLTKLYGKTATEELLRSLTEIPRLCIRMNPLKTDPAALTAAFRERKMALTPSALTPGVFIVERPRDVFSLPAFLEGHFTAQDEAAAQVVLHGQPTPGERWLDLCAAPGGKSTQLAECMKNTGTVIACDVVPEKVEKIREHAERLGLSVVETRVQDAREYNPAWEGAFDGVLVDAPCSGLGLLRRKPDIKYHRTQADIQELVQLQTEILSRAARYVKPGGVLLYSTCTLLAEENEEQIANFLLRHPAFSPDGDDFERRTDMAATGADGFYMARLRRR